MRPISGSKNRLYPERQNTTAEAIPTCKGMNVYSKLRAKGTCSAYALWNDKV